MRIGKSMRLLANLICILLSHLFEIAASLSVDVTLLLIILFKLKPSLKASLTVDLCI